MAAPNLALSSGLAHSCKNAPIQQAQSQRAISPIVHLVAPSSRPDNGDDEAEMRPPTNPRTFGALTTERERMRTQIQRSFDLHVTDPVKIAARKVSASPDTVESHRANVPKSWAQMIAYCRAYPAFGLEILDLMGIDIDRDRTAYAVFLALKQQMRGA